MPNKAVTVSQNDKSLDEVSTETEKTSAHPPVAQADVTFAGDEEVRLAGEKVFRLHARLFEELAK